MLAGKGYGNVKKLVNFVLYVTFFQPTKNSSGESHVNDIKEMLQQMF